ncbi:hypothetical protein H6P81_016970 [Aristolochia fimbriata]|uniref:Uncharacterized protein n=1 Tax=Aristolochia fimbriata TaxID=158543 RepID=A0AAV7DZU6_ARIFI|nr:hypothetical protein H6P81_016970 [Aristolochia fimbriata]
MRGALPIPLSSKFFHHSKKSLRGMFRSLSETVSSTGGQSRPTSEPSSCSSSCEEDPSEDSNAKELPAESKGLKEVLAVQPPDVSDAVKESLPQTVSSTKGQSPEDKEEEQSPNLEGTITLKPEDSEKHSDSESIPISQLPQKRPLSCKSPPVRKKRNLASQVPTAQPHDAPNSGSGIASRLRSRPKRNRAPTSYLLDGKVTISTSLGFSDCLLVVLLVNFRSYPPQLVMPSWEKRGKASRSTLFSVPLQYICFAPDLLRILFGDYDYFKGAVLTSFSLDFNDKTIVCDGVFCLPQRRGRKLLFFYTTLHVRTSGNPLSTSPQFALLLSEYCSSRFAAEVERFGGARTANEVGQRYESENLSCLCCSLLGIELKSPIFVFYVIKTSVVLSLFPLDSYDYGCEALEGKVAEDLISNLMVELAEQVGGTNPEEMIAEEPIKNSVRELVQIPIKNSVGERNSLGGSSEEPIKNPVGEFAEKPVRSSMGKFAEEPVRNSVGEFAGEPRNSAGEFAEEPIRNSVEEMAEEPRRNTSESMPEEQSRKMVDHTAEEQSRKMVDHMAEEQSRKTVDHMAEGQSRKMVDHTAEEPKKNSVLEMVQEPSRSSFEKMAKSLSRNAAERMAEGPSWNPAALMPMSTVRSSMKKVESANRRIMEKMDEDSMQKTAEDPSSNSEKLIEDPNWNLKEIKGFNQEILDIVKLAATPLDVDDPIITIRRVPESIYEVDRKAYTMRYSYKSCAMIPTSKFKNCKLALESVCPVYNNCPSSNFMSIRNSNKRGGTREVELGLTGLRKVNQQVLVLKQLNCRKHGHDDKREARYLKRTTENGR